MARYRFTTRNAAAASGLGFRPSQDRKMREAARSILAWGTCLWLTLVAARGREKPEEIAEPDLSPVPLGEPGDSPRALAAALIAGDPEPPEWVLRQSCGTSGMRRDSTPNRRCSYFVPMMDRQPQPPEYPNEADVDAVIAEFDCNAREAIRGLLHDLAVLAGDYESSVSHGFVRGELPRTGLQQRP